MDGQPTNQTDGQRDYNIKGDRDKNASEITGAVNLDACYGWSFIRMTFLKVKNKVTR
jgi:hypothetical protein